MLGTLRKIVQEVNAAKDLKAALGIIVLRVKEAMGSHVCSVYLLDPETERFVLMATEGLNKRAIGKVSMAPSEGLVGLVGTREEPLNLEHASEHPAIATSPKPARNATPLFSARRSFTIAASWACWSSSSVNGGSSTRARKPSSLP